MQAIETAFVIQTALWSLLIWAAAFAVPASYPHIRRAVALTGLWGLWVIPWLPAAPQWAGLEEQGIPLPYPSEGTIGSLAAIWPKIWLAGTIWQLFRLGHEMMRNARIRLTEPLSLPWLPEHIRTYYSAQVEGPCMTGWWSPRVLLPLGARHWPERELRAALRHEIQHIRQHDGLHRLYTALLQALFWWNPALHALCRLYETESEVCCDLAALETRTHRKAYGEMLLAHASGNYSAHRLAVPFAQKSGLRSRIERLLGTPDDAAPRRMYPLRWIVFLALLLVATLLPATIHKPSVPSNPSEPSLHTEAQLRLLANPFPGQP